MAHLQRVTTCPFHYALADAFTICDDYHCSHDWGRTDPNRYYMPGPGWVGNDGKNGGGPVIANDEIGYSAGTTYPERLLEGRRLLEGLPRRR